MLFMPTIENISLSPEIILKVTEYLDINERLKLRRLSKWWFNSLSRIPYSILCNLKVDEAIENNNQRLFELTTRSGFHYSLMNIEVPIPNPFKFPRITTSFYQTNFDLNCNVCVATTDSEHIPFPKSFTTFDLESDLKELFQAYFQINVSNVHVMGNIFIKSDSEKDLPETLPQCHSQIMDETSPTSRSYSLLSDTSIVNQISAVRLNTEESPFLSDLAGYILELENLRYLEFESHVLMETCSRDMYQILLLSELETMVLDENMLLDGTALNTLAEHATLKHLYMGKLPLADFSFEFYRMVMALGLETLGTEFKSAIDLIQRLELKMDIIPYFQSISQIVVTITDKNTLMLDLIYLIKSFSKLLPLKNLVFVIHQDLKCQDHVKMLEMIKCCHHQLQELHLRVYVEQVQAVF
ncbi:hypothetical protein BC833DRAFT_660904 [Globomyces pollinis-pini]|nr:hypothetical protein BC833DRAFT_660904 [Globomyces pollinis-pini]